MRTWIVIYKEKGKTKSKVIRAKTFDDAVIDAWREFFECDIKAVFEVAK